MVNAYVPGFVADAAVIVTVDETPLTGFGLMLPTAPGGRPLTESVTAGVKFRRRMSTVYIALPPAGFTVWDGG